MAFGFMGRQIPGIGRKLTTKEFSDVFSIPLSEVQRHCRSHGCPKVAKAGQGTTMEMPEWIRWYTHQVRLDERQELFAKYDLDKVGGGKEVIPHAVEKAQEEMKLLKAKTRKAELEAGLLDGSMVFCEVVKHNVLEACHGFVALLSAVPGRMANRLAGVDSPAEVREELYKEVLSIREQVDETMGKLSFHKSTAERDGGSVSSSTSEDSGRVGGQEQSPS